MGLEEAVGHPGHTKDREDSYHAGLKDRTVGDGLLLDLAKHKDAGAGHEHDHLDNQVHGQGLELARHAKGRPQLGKRAEDDHRGDGGKEKPHGPVGFLGKNLVEQGGPAAVDVGLLFGVGQLGLEFRILVQILAPMHAPKASAQHTNKGGRDGD